MGPLQLLTDDPDEPCATKLGQVQDNLVLGPVVAGRGDAPCDPRARDRLVVLQFEEKAEKMLRRDRELGCDLGIRAPADVRLERHGVSRVAEVRRRHIWMNRTEPTGIVQTRRETSLRSVRHCGGVNLSAGKSPFICFACSSVRRPLIFMAVASSTP